MTNDSLTEWREINSILLLFCNATGLQINWDKSTFHFSNLTDQSLFSLQSLFPHTFTNLSKGFDYLGYFIKVNSYRVSDWNWILEKVKKKLGTGAIVGSLSVGVLSLKSSSRRPTSLLDGIGCSPSHCAS
jgi:hypothetical protein